MIQLSVRLVKVLDEYLPLLESVNPTTVYEKANPERWSIIEVMGHLIDSAANNHHRFIRAQFKTDLVFDGYRQDEWVRVQGYQHADWRQVLNLWKSYNRHLVMVISRISDEVLMRECKNHNLNKIAFKTVSADQVATLNYFINDYIDHLVHHLSHIVQPKVS